MIKQSKISLRKGVKNDLPTNAPLGEPLFCMDTGEMYVGMGEDSPIKQVVDTEVKSQLESKAKRTFVCPSEFGAKGDGVTDDSSKLFDMHYFANINGLNVEYENKIYYIKTPLNIPINTNVNFNNAIIIIENANESKYDSWFVIKSGEPIELDESSKSALLSELVGNQGQRVNFGSKYKDKLIYLHDSNDVEYYRWGDLNSPKYKCEVVCITNKDNSSSSILRKSFSGLTSATMYNIDKDTIEIKGGKFLLTLNASSIGSGTYSAPIFDCLRSRTTFTNMVFENESNINANITPSLGQISFRYTYGCSMENVKILPRRKTDHGTYAILFNSNECLEFKKIDGFTNSYDFWGVTGSNYNTNVLFEDCRLNRIDSHMDAVDWTIKNCVLGNYGLQMHGRGNLLIEDTTQCVNDSASFINLRSDYLCEWLGDITIKNCKAIIDSSTDLDFNIFRYGGLVGSNRDHKKPIALLGENITIDNFEVINNCSGKLTSNAYYFPRIVNSYTKFVLPKNINIKNINIKNKKETDSSTIIYIDNTSMTYNAKNEKVIIDNSVNVNSTIDIDNCSGYISIYNTDNTVTQSIYVPFISVRNSVIDILTDDATLKCKFDNSLIQSINQTSVNPCKLQLLFNDCIMQLKGVNTNARFIHVKKNNYDSNLNVNNMFTFINCTFKLPIINGVIASDSSTAKTHMEYYNIFGKLGAVGVHIGTKFDRSIILLDALNSSNLFNMNTLESANFLKYGAEYKGDLTLKNFTPLQTGFPSSGYYVKGDIVVSSNNVRYLCTNTGFATDWVWKANAYPIVSNGGILSMLRHSCIAQNGYVYQSFNGGTTGATLPTFSTTIGSVTFDNNQKWICLGAEATFTTLG